MIGLGSDKNTIFDVYIKLIQNSCRCQTAIYEDFFNTLCTSSMYSSSSSNSSISASVIFDLAVAFSCWQWENLISGESRALGFLSLIPSEILPLHDFFSHFLSHGFQCIRYPSTSSCRNWEQLVPLLNIFIIIIKHLQLKPCCRQSLTFCPS